MLFSSSFGANFHLRVSGHHFGVHTAAESHGSLCYLVLQISCILFFFYTFLFYPLNIQLKAIPTRLASLPENTSFLSSINISSLIIRGPGLGTQSILPKQNKGKELYLGNQPMTSHISFLSQNHIHKSCRGNLTTTSASSLFPI